MLASLPNKISQRGLPSASGTPMPQGVPFDAVDVHHHLWEIGRSPYAWLSPKVPPRPFGDHSAIKRNHLPDACKAEAAKTNVTATVHLQANSGAQNASEETARLASTAKVFGSPNAIVGYTDLCGDNLEDILNTHQRFNITRGMRALAAWEQGNTSNFTDRPDVLRQRSVLRGAAASAERGLCLDIVALSHQLTDVALLADAVPYLRITVDHLGMPRPEIPHDIQYWIEGIDAIAARPNTAIKLSDLWTIDRAWSLAKLEPFVRHALTEFGAIRIMCGSNLPIEKLMCPVSRQVDVLTVLISAIDPKVIDDVFSGTASRLCRLGTFSGLAK